MSRAFPICRRAAAALVLAVAVAGPTAGQTVEGSYRRNGTDRMIVRLVERGLFAVHIETTGEAGHSCEVDERLELRGTSAHFSDLENAARDWSIVFVADGAFISYVGTHPWYCGVRANFRGEWRRE